MKNFLFPVLVISSFIISFQSAGANPLHFNKPDTGEVRAALRKVNLAYGESFVKGDSSMFLNAYTSDACLMPSASPALCGVGGQLAFYKFAYRSGVRNIIFTTVNIYGLTDEYVTEQGYYEIFDGSNASLGKGKYLVLWKKTAGSWKMFRDMFNSNAPTAARTK